MRTTSQLCTYMLGYAAPALADLTDEHRALAPAPNSKTAGWILGHLCVSGDYVRRKCGRPPLTPREWGPKFAPGTQPSLVASEYPSMTELRSTLDAVYRDLAEIAPTWNDEMLDGENPLEFSRHRFPTARGFFSHVMTSHLGYHLGQLAGWRAAAGLEMRPGAGGRP